MPEQLLEPLPTALGSLVVAMRAGTPHVIAGKGGGSYNWPDIVGRQHGLAEEFLREKMEKLSQGKRTVRGACTSLLPRSFPVVPLFLVAVCDGSRPAGAVEQLQYGDFLYAITASEGLSFGLELYRLD